jgi:hypothetical protein
MWRIRLDTLDMLDFNNPVPAAEINKKSLNEHSDFG